MTSEFILAPGEKYLQCPYNVSHQITNTRMLTHLDKCRKAYLKTTDGQHSRWEICRYNQTHQCPREEIRFHEENCPDAASVLSYLSHHNSSEGSQYYHSRRQQDLANNSDREHSRDRRDRDRDRDRRGERHRDRDRDRQHDHDVKPFASASAEGAQGNLNAWGLEEENWETEATGDQPGYDPQIKLKSELVIYNPSGLTKSERKKFRREVQYRHDVRTLTGQHVDLPLPSDFDVKPDVKLLGDQKVFSNPIVKKEPMEQRELEPGEIIESEEEEYDVVDYANQEVPPPPPPETRGTSSSSSSRISSSTTSNSNSNSTSKYQRDFERRDSHSRSDIKREYEYRDSRREDDKMKRPKNDDEGPWPWPDDGTDVISGDDDDFPGYDPYA